MKTMHLFAGGGGGLLADLILGHEPVVAVECEPYPCQVLRERAAEGWFPNLQVWEGDVRLFNPSEYKGRVDIVHAGFPCQDISNAGNQAGIGEGTRSGLYREVLRIADEIQPEHIFLENVAAICTIDDGAALRTVVADLAEMGFDSQWVCLSAAQVGAAHKRDRWWLLAYSKHSTGRQEVGRVDGEKETEAAGERKADRDTRESGRAGCNSDVLAYSSSKPVMCESNDGRNLEAERQQGSRVGDTDGGNITGDVSNSAEKGLQRPHEQSEGKRLRPEPSRSCENVADTKRIGQQGHGQHVDTGDPAQDREREASDAVNERIRSERQAESSMGGVADDVPDNMVRWNDIEAEVGRVTDESQNRADKLKALGNAQVPLQAATAFSILWQMMEAANAA